MYWLCMHRLVYIITEQDSTAEKVQAVAVNGKMKQIGF